MNLNFLKERKNVNTLILIVVIFVIAKLFGDSNNNFEILMAIGSLFLYGFLFAALPKKIYKESIEKQASSSKNVKSTQEQFRKFILVVYSICFILSLATASVSVFIFDGSDHPKQRLIIFLSLLLMPLFVGTSMILSKKRMWWLLLPIIPILIIVFFGNF